MGSRSSEEYAYIAGFLDGDGSLMLQIKKRKDSPTGLRFMATICFYQDTRHEKYLRWIRKVCHIGYLTRRNDGMSELRVNGYQQVHTILLQLQPFVRFKSVQVKALLQACRILSSSTLKKLSKKEKNILVDLVLTIQNENYGTKKKRSREVLTKLLDLTP